MALLQKQPRSRRGRAAVVCATAMVGGLVVMAYRDPGSSRATKKLATFAESDKPRPTGPGGAWWISMPLPRHDDEKPSVADLCGDSKVAAATPELCGGYDDGMCARHGWDVDATKKDPLGPATFFCDSECGAGEAALCAMGLLGDLDTMCDKALSNDEFVRRHREQNDERAAERNYWCESMAAYGNGLTSKIYEGLQWTWNTDQIDTGIDPDCDRHAWCAVCRGTTCSDYVKPPMANARTRANCAMAVLGDAPAVCAARAAAR